MDSTSRRRGRGSKGLLLLALVLGAAASPLTIPKDMSLSGAEYRRLGLAPAEETWTIDDYINALEVLSKQRREVLPRAASEISGVYFERLLACHREFPEFVLRQRQAVLLSTLYGRSARDDFLFDREWVAIRATDLDVISSSGATVGEIQDLERSATKGYSTSAPPGQLAETLVETSRLLDLSSGQVRERASALLYLATYRELSPKARSDLAGHVLRQSSAMRCRLVEGDRAMLVAATLDRAALALHRTDPDPCLPVR